MLHRVWRGLVWLDQAANWTLGWVLGGGRQPWGWTISDRLWLLRSQGRRVGIMGCRLLHVVDKDHCAKAIKGDA